MPHKNEQTPKQLSNEKVNELTQTLIVLCWLVLLPVMILLCLLIIWPFESSEKPAFTWQLGFIMSIGLVTVWPLIYSMHQLKSRKLKYLQTLKAVFGGLQLAWIFVVVAPIIVLVLGDKVDTFGMYLGIGFTVICCLYGILGHLFLKIVHEHQLERYFD